MGLFRSRWYLAVLLVLFACPFLFGCSKKDQVEEEKEARPPGIIDYMTGKEQVNQYQKMRTKLLEVDETVKERYKEIQ